MQKLKIALLLAAATLLSGCASWWLGGSGGMRTGNSSSLVDFLYPDGQQPAALPDRLPYLALPLRVGIAFVPGSDHNVALPASEQQLLLQRVADAFRDRPFVSDIEVIPQSYLRTARGLQGMQQVARLHNVDVMALVSYDQLALAGERDSAILYWTVVGALMVKGNVNEVQTMIDTAVFDVGTTRLLFRAPGVHRQSDNSTYMDAERDMRSLQQQSFSVATDDMILNLNHELEQFREQVRRGERAEVEWKEGHGGGSVGLAAMLVLCLAALRRRRGATADQ